MILFASIAARVEALRERMAESTRQVEAFEVAEYASHHV